MGLLDFLFGSKPATPKSYPVLKPEMLHPVDNKITTQEAKRLFREWMLRIGYLDKQEVGDHVGYLADEIRDHEQGLKDDLKEAKERLTEDTKQAKEDCKRIEKELKTCKDAVKKAELEEELKEAQEDMELDANGARQDIAEAEASLAAFKEDKREFLVRYINQQVRGH